MPTPPAMTNTEPDLMYLLFFISAVTIISRITRGRGNSGPRGTFSRRPRPDFWEFTESLSENDFHRTFRMSRNAFKELCRLVRPHISPRYANQADQEKERKSHVAGRDVQTEVKVALFLRILAGGNFLDVHLLFGIGRSSAFRIFRCVLAIVLKVLPWKSFPKKEDLDGFKEMALDFTLSRPHINPLLGCVAALDGLQIRIVCPSRGYNPLPYFSRKGYFSIPVQALVDANYRFIACSILAVGATHDNAALMLSEIYEYLESDQMPKGFWVAGDEAYTCSKTLIIPFARAVCSPVHDGFNFFQSSHRIHIEQAFGILKRRWGILQKPLAFDVSLSTKIVPAAMKLHNFCLKMDCAIAKPGRTSIELRIAQERLQFWLNWCVHGVDVDSDIAYEVEDMSASATRAEAKSETRGKLVKIVRREGLRRPEYPPAEEMVDLVPLL